MKDQIPGQGELTPAEPSAEEAQTHVDAVSGDTSDSEIAEALARGVQRAREVLDHPEQQQLPLPRRPGAPVPPEGKRGVPPPTGERPPIPEDVLDARRKLTEGAPAREPDILTRTIEHRRLR